MSYAIHACNGKLFAASSLLAPSLQLPVALRSPYAAHPPACTISPTWPVYLHILAFSQKENLLDHTCKPKKMLLIKRAEADSRTLGGTRILQELLSTAPKPRLQLLLRLCVASLEGARIHGAGKHPASSCAHIAAMEDQAERQLVVLLGIHALRKEHTGSGA